MLAITALYFLIFMWVVWEYLRRRDPLLRAVMLVIGAVAMLFVIGVLRVAFGVLPQSVTVLFSLLLLGQPFFVVQLMSRVRPVPRWLLAAALAGWAATAVPVAVLEHPMPRPAAMAVVTVFFAVQTMASVLLAAEARRRGGAARIRLWCAAAGTLLFGVALLIAGGGRPVFAVSARAVAVVSAVMYLLAFVPPQWLRRRWSLLAANEVMRRMLSAPANEPPEGTWLRYCREARTVLGSDEVAVVLPAPAGTVRWVASTPVDTESKQYPASDLDRLLHLPAATIDALAGWTHPPALAVDLAESSGTRFVTAAPTTLDGRDGALVLLNRYRTLFAEDDVALVARLATQAAAVAERGTLLTAKQQLAVIVESSHDAIVARDLDGVITSWNAAAERLYGFPAAEAIGQPGTITIPAEQLAAEAALMDRVARGERIEQHQLPRRRKDGTTVTVSRTMSPIADAQGAVVGVATIARDVTERQRAETMFRGLLESAPDAIIGITHDDAITLLNVQAERLFGYSRAELLGRSVEVLMPERMRPEYARIRRAYFADPEPRTIGGDGDLTVVRKDGTEFPVEISLSALHTDQGIIVSAGVRDITERLRAQADRERLAAEHRLQHTRRLESLGQLAGGVAHDFNNILGVIASYTELLFDTVDSLDTAAANPRDIAAARTDLGQIAKAAERATRLTKQLLAFGRRDITQAQVLDINHVIGNVEQMLRRTLGEHIHLVTNLDQHAQPITADPSHLEQILLNLAVNARDAMPTGGTLSIDTTTVDLPAADDDTAHATVPPGRYVRLRVSDTGTGMPPEVAERAFEPFFTTKPTGSGTGLGLATIYGLATAAGGDVRLSSEPGIGTTVTVLLPALDATAATRRPVPADPSPAPTPHETILLVEDEAPLRDVTTRILTRAGYDVLQASDGPTAIDTANSHPAPIHLLLTDVIMPDMMGNEVAARIRTARPETPVLYMSGYAQPVLTEHGTLPPGVTIVEKPFTSQQLLARIRETLHRERPATTHP
ncbi:hybrid sensor histidine kinase/response regulator [Krasilnikovia cinnamomea]|nr:PAS domain S-box protein [Krasilnikovia cinnamomea]